jgi:hypothetical protein
LDLNVGWVFVVFSSSVGYSGTCGPIVVCPYTVKKFRLGEGSVNGVPYGVEKALYKFNEGETSHLKISRKYGLSQEVYELNNLAHDAVFSFTVKLISFENVGFCGIVEFFLLALINISVTPLLAQRALATGRP